MNREKLSELLSGDIVAEEKNIYIWGTGNTSSLYQEGLFRLEKEGFLFKGYGDNNSDKWGTTYGGKNVYSPEEICADKLALVLIASPQPKVITAINSQMNNLKIECMHIDEFILRKHKNEVLQVYDMLEDEKSKNVYSELVLCRIKGKYPADEFVDHDQYFSFDDFGEYDANEVFVDCGAYVGDTLETYIWRKEGTFKKIIAFEPDVKNVTAMNYRIDRLKREWNFSDDKFEVYPFGVSDVDSISYVERYDANNGFGSKMLSNRTDNSEECRVVSIDGIIKEKIGFLKADIESYEYKMLLGAKKNISKYAPKLAICIYHNCVDFYSVPLLIKEINPDYKLAVRHYTHMLSDTVLYAYV